MHAVIHAFILPMIISYIFWDNRIKMLLTNKYHSNDFLFFMNAVTAKFCLTIACLVLKAFLNSQNQPRS